MNVFQRLLSLFSNRPPSADTRFLTIYLLSQRCREPIKGRIDLLNDLSGGEEGESAYHTRKLFHTSGEDRCFSQVEVEIWFNASKTVVNKEVVGGRWLEEGEYHALVEARAAEREARRLAAEAEIAAAPGEIPPAESHSNETNTN